MLEAKIADAVRRYNALTAQEQRMMRELQRRSWVIGEMMLEHPEMTRIEAEELYDRVVF